MEQRGEFYFHTAYACDNHGAIPAGVESDICDFLFVLGLVSLLPCQECFDTVGSASGRASSL